MAEDRRPAEAGSRRARRGPRDQLALGAVVPRCPHCAEERTRLDAAMADDGAVSGDRWRCESCGGVWWQLRLPLPPAR